MVVYEFLKQHNVPYESMVPVADAHATYEQYATSFDKEDHSIAAGEAPEDVKAWWENLLKEEGASLDSDWIGMMRRFHREALDGLIKGLMAPQSDGDNNRDVIVIDDDDDDEKASASSPKRKRDGGDGDSPTRKRHKPDAAAAATTEFLNRIHVLTGYHSQNDGVAVALGYWDPTKCACTNWRIYIQRILASNALEENEQELDKDEMSHVYQALVIFLLTGEDLDDVFKERLKKYPLKDAESGAFFFPNHNCVDMDV